MIVKTPSQNGAIFDQRVVVERPSRFGWLSYRFWTLLGLTRNELGGFGGLIGESGGG